MPKSRILYIDNLRIVLTFLVVAHHWAIAHGAPGDWYLSESGLSEIGTLLMTLFVATNQAFFMGFFFLISAYFVPKSLEIKGTKKFITGRVIRLGIPLLVYNFFLSKIVIFIAIRNEGTLDVNFLDYLFSWRGIGLGPMWFVWVLLLFTFLFLGLKRVLPATFFERFGNTLFKPLNMAITMIVIIAITFLVRINFPVGRWSSIFGFQPAHFTQYIFAFFIGILVFHSNVFEKFTRKFTWRWFGIAQILILVCFPLIFVLFDASEGTDKFMGGLTVESLSYTIWEQLVAISLMISFLGLFKHYFNKQSNFMKDISAQAYGIYFIHPLILVVFLILLQDFMKPSLMKFLITIIPALFLSYLAAKVLRMIPGVKKVL